MTAWEDIQLDWAKKSETKDLTGVLLWDLSAAFDTLDCDIFCKKIALYGFVPNTVNWFRSFLSNRSQKVKIGSAVSTVAKLSSGVPQGGVISPLILSLENKTTRNIVNASYLFTQFSTLAKTYTTTAREPSIHTYIHQVWASL